MYRSVCVGPGRKPHYLFSHEAAQLINIGFVRVTTSLAVRLPFFLVLVLVISRLAFIELIVLTEHDNSWLVRAAEGGIT